MTSQRARIVTPFAAAALAALMTTVPTRQGRAFEPVSKPCFSTAPNWNATNGKLVSGVSGGPIAAMFGALGQTRTHVMMSNVTPDGVWATHATTRRPSIHESTVKVCVLGICVDAGKTPNQSTPLKALELAKGSPGFTAINIGGAYAYWSGASSVYRQYLVPITPSELQDPNFCGNSCKQSATANYLWWDISYWTKTSAANSNTWYYDLGATDPSGVSRHFSYGLHQFMRGTSRGQFGSNYESVTTRGIACSQVPTWGYRNWVLATNPKIAAGTSEVSMHQYTRNQTIAAGNAVWNKLYNECMGVDPGFWGGMVNMFTDILGTSVQEQTCSRAAYQVLNCFLQGENSDGTGCTASTSTAWNAYKADSSKAGAKSVSPEDILGMAGIANAGPWSNSTQQLLQWNGGGSTYGCFY